MALFYRSPLWLTLYNIVDIIGTIAPGDPPKSATIDTPGQDAFLTFGGTAGQQVSLLINSWGAPVFGGSVLIRRPDGTVLASASGQTGSFMDSRTLPVTGDYTVWIALFGSATGSVSFTLYDATDATGVITPGGPPVTLTTTSPGQNMRLTFTSDAGQFVSVSVLAPFSSGFTRLFAPNGTELAAASFNSNPNIGTTGLPATGTYTILLNPSGTATGSATVTLNNASPGVTGTITIAGPPLAVTFPGSGVGGLITFNGEAGQTVSVHFANNTLGCPSIFLASPDGALLAFADFSCNSSFDFNGVTLPASGVYKLIINRANNGSVSISVTSP
jgi:hypothetical protein